MKKFVKGVSSFLCLVIAATAINMAIRVAMDGMWLFGIPEPEKVTSVTIKYPSLTDEEKEITDPEEIDICVHLSGFLRYKPFANAEGKDEPLITFYYHLTNGDQVEVSANGISVFYNGKKHVLKDDNSFVNMVNGIFYQEAFVG